MALIHPTHQCPQRTTIATKVLHQFSESLGTAIDAKDPCTSLHSEEVAEVAHFIALAMGLSASEADLIHVAGHLHDIGKIGIPDAVLMKKTPLNESDWKYIRCHPDVGADILRPVEALAESGIVDMVRYHHERFDGKGYPCGLEGEAIPLGARIIALADTLSAILQNRPYRPAQDFEDAVAEIINCSGTQFDPDVVSAFLKIKKEVYSMLQYLNPDNQGAA
ncbi:MAG: HD-GYP domain-containing protein [Desulfobacterales bacterium]|nr:HD-GYP domain-containing protein [Desulfobacterales bacterium]